MVNLIKDPFVKHKANPAGHRFSEKVAAQDRSSAYEGYVEPDTKVPPKPKSVLKEVSVNGVKISESKIMAEAQQHPAENPGTALMAAAKALVVRELLLQKARSCKIAVKPDVLEEGVVESSEDALIRALMDQEIKTPVSDRANRKRYYDLNKYRFKSEAIYEARHILLAVRSESEKNKRRQEANALIQKAVANPSIFGALASEHSDCPSQAEGGNLGQLTKGSTVPEFEAVLEKMEPGQIWPEPVTSRYGLHIIYLVNKVPGQPLPFEMAEERIGAWLEASSWSKAVAQYVGILVGKADIKGIQIEGVDSPLVQ